MKEQCMPVADQVYFEGNIAIFDKDAFFL